jgi:hypothetical protein
MVSAALDIECARSPEKYRAEFLQEKPTRQSQQDKASTNV